ncbi:MAG: hypothetical protein LBD28_07875 [Tannerellaceae bacterium]|jgi:hypothetical protein|nr:hypothetical protein [Tannerellaceae bacterium]
MTGTENINRSEKRIPAFENRAGLRDFDLPKFHLALACEISICQNSIWSWLARFRFAKIPFGASLRDFGLPKFHLALACEISVCQNSIWRWLARFFFRASPNFQHAIFILNPQLIWSIY